MNTKFMHMRIFLVIAVTLSTRLASAASLYDCSSPRPEMVGFHNMVLFGKPDDQLYVYHLPLFAGSVNGESGHVLMHVYQGLWKAQLDSVTKKAYDLKFADTQTKTNPLPFFSIGPKGKRFKVPEMICTPGFSMEALAVYGHIESNPNFPSPQKLISQLSQVTTQDVIFAKRFNGGGKPALTYHVFGTPKQYYMVHELTDDKNSFDQIVGIEILDTALKKQVDVNGSVAVSVPLDPENGLVPLTENAGQSSPNNKWKLPTVPLGKTLSVLETASSTKSRIEITGEVYFNANNDLKK